MAKAPHRVVIERRLDITSAACIKLNADGASRVSLEVGDRLLSQPTIQSSNHYVDRS